MFEAGGSSSSLTASQRNTMCSLWTCINEQHSNSSILSMRQIRRQISVSSLCVGHVQCNILKFPWSVFITCLTRYLTFTPASPHSEPPGGKKTDWKPDNKLIYFTKNPKEPWPLICNTAQDVLILKTNRKSTILTHSVHQDNIHRWTTRSKN